MRIRKILPILVLAAAVGCNSGSGSKPQPTAKQQLTEKWNIARADVLATLATEQYQSGNADKARATVDNAIAMNPKSATLHVLSAKIAMEQAQLERADKELQLAALMDPKIAEADYLRGVVYERWQKPQEALGFYQTAADKAPDELGYVMASAEMLVAMGKADDALGLLKSKLDTFEHSGVIRDAMGQLLVGQARYGDAVKALREAVMLTTDDDTIKEHLSLALYYNKQYREASDLISRLVATDRYKQRVDLYLALGESFEQIGRTDDAKAAFETATTVGSGTPEAWIGLAKVSLEKNDIRRAEMSLHKAATLDPASGETQLMLGYIRLRQNRLNDAMPFFKKASALNQSDTVSLCMVGYTYQKAGQTEQAIKCYAQALKIHPGDEFATKLMASVDMN